jgi:hypothetical protein
MNLFLPFVSILLYLDYVVAVRRKIIIYSVCSDTLCTYTFIPSS